MIWQISVDKDALREQAVKILTNHGAGTGASSYSSRVTTRISRNICAQSIQGLNMRSIDIHKTRLCLI